MELEDLTVGHVYEIRSRNLQIAVYRGSGAFTGIREKFDHRYLFTEWYGSTVRAVVKDLGAVPEGIPIDEHLPIEDEAELKRREEEGIVPWRSNAQLFALLDAMEEE